MTWLSNLLSTQDASIALILGCMLALNATLTGLKKGLDLIKDRTAAKWDNDLSDLLGKFLGGASKGVEFLSANSTALPPSTKKEIEDYVAAQVKAQTGVDQKGSAPPS